MTISLRWDNQAEVSIIAFPVPSSRDHRYLNDVVLLVLSILKKIGP
jgi:hypothetical protein